MKLLSAALLVLSLGVSIAQARRAPDPVEAQQKRVLACHQQAERDMAKPVQLPLGDEASMGARAIGTRKALPHGRLRTEPS
jgi:hypothetical protein